jgi:hypothetical protein
MTHISILRFNVTALRQLFLIFHTCATLNSHSYFDAKDKRQKCSLLGSFSHVKLVSAHRPATFTLQHCKILNVTIHVSGMFLQIVNDVSEAIRFSKTSVIIYQSERHNIPTELNLQQHFYRNLKSRIYQVIRKHTDA